MKIQLFLRSDTENFQFIWIQSRLKNVAHGIDCLLVRNLCRRGCVYQLEWSIINDMLYIYSL